MNRQQRTFMSAINTDRPAFGRQADLKVGNYYIPARAIFLNLV